MDTIFISELKVKTKLGVPAWERMLAQTIILDIEMAYDLSAAGQSDAIADTIDYAAVVACVTHSLKQQQFQLLEALAEHLCQLILKQFGAHSVKLKLAKPAILPHLKALGIVIERQQTVAT
jgi:7,8-dihydroneopterin aldolase/epimerase/oxygenase